MYLAVDDAEATVDAAARQRRQVIVPPMDVEALGTMAVVTDVGGAAIGMWQPGEHRGFGVLGEPGTPSWFELHTRDYDATVAFYRDVFEWDTHTASDTPEFRYTTLGEGDDATSRDHGRQRLPARRRARALVGLLPASTTPTRRWRGSSSSAGRRSAGRGHPVRSPGDATDPTGALFKLVGDS